jgi:quinol-cytochrome oxidoreductase complex cytochrome b subunit
MLLITQVLSGIFLACYYIPHELYALKSIIFILKEVQGG